MDRVGTSRTSQLRRFHDSLTVHNGTRPRLAKCKDLYCEINPFIRAYQDFPKKTQVKVLEGEWLIVLPKIQEALRYVWKSLPSLSQRRTWNIFYLKAHFSDIVEWRAAATSRRVRRSSLLWIWESWLLSLDLSGLRCKMETLKKNPYPLWDTYYFQQRIVREKIIDW